ncbi:hypothetical protein D9611_011841 [Ephemerocybe angulata]|uniref:C2H2-type domain-containing protein n=1 Tax=Ephemerocybe angulata TaxID=980116 RepID=A0A8H5BY85_9AGAR|nr:hypothetical protein D9611_011841 [Tulosesus angulatus]
MSEASAYECVDCGKTYSAPRFLESHQRSCRKAKRSFSQILEETRLLWEAKKRRRLDAAQEISQPPVIEQPGEEEIVNEEEVTSVVVRSTRQIRQNPRYLDNGWENVNEVTEEVVSVAVRSKREIRRNPRYLDNGWETAPIEINDDIAALASTSRVKLSDIRRLIPVPHPGTVNTDPDSILTPKDFTKAGLCLAEASNRFSPTAPLLAGTPLYGPFPNRSSFEVAEWFWNSNSKSFLEFQKLMGIFKQPTFSFEDMLSTNWAQTFKSLGANKHDLTDDDGAWIDDDGWKATKISIDVPFHSHMRGAPGTKPHNVGVLHHRSIMSVIKEKISNVDAFSQFHYTPYKSTWKPTEDDPEVELYGEMYASRAFREAHEEVQRLPRNEGNAGLERVVIGLMFSSDATSLTHFGPASLWPCYLMFANESKSRRCEPNERLCHHIAYFQTVSCHLPLHWRNHS